MSRGRRLLRDSGLSLAFAAAFLLSLAGQAFAGRALLAEDRAAEGLAPTSMVDYLTSPHFAVDVTENWQSEYFQFLLFVFATVWLVQRGSPESKSRPGRGTDAEQKVGAYAEPGSPRWARVGGWRTRVYSHSLSLMMGSAFLGSWAAQSVAGWAAHNEERLQRLQDPLSWTGYLAAPEFWSRTFQNWQSELLAVWSMVALAIFLRERGSPESKPVGEPHDSHG